MSQLTPEMRPSEGWMQPAFRRWVDRGCEPNGIGFNSRATTLHVLPRLLRGHTWWGGDPTIATPGAAEHPCRSPFMNYGRFDETTPSGDVVGRFSGGDYAVQGGATWALDSLWTVGVTGFTGLRNLEKFNAGVLGMDVGVVRRSPDGLRALGLLVSTWDFKRTFQASCQTAGAPQCPNWLDPRLP